MERSLTINIWTSHKNQKHILAYIHSMLEHIFATYNGILAKITKRCGAWNAHRKTYV